MKADTQQMGEVDRILVVRASANSRKHHASPLTLRCLKLECTHFCSMTENSSYFIDYASDLKEFCQFIHKRFCQLNSGGKQESFDMVVTSD